jgi:hypothetical protein
VYAARQGEAKETEIKFWLVLIMKIHLIGAEPSTYRRLILKFTSEELLEEYAGTYLRIT